MENAPILVSINEATRLIGVGRSKLYDLMAEGALTTAKVGRRRLIHRESIEAFVSAATEQRAA